MPTTELRVRLAQGPDDMKLIKALAGRGRPVVGDASRDVGRAGVPGGPPPEYGYVVVEDAGRPVGYLGFTAGGVGLIPAVFVESAGVVPGFPAAKALAAGLSAVHQAVSRNPGRGYVALDIPAHAVAARAGALAAGFEGLQAPPGAPSHRFVRFASRGPR